MDVKELIEKTAWMWIEAGYESEELIDFYIYDIEAAMQRMEDNLYGEREVMRRVDT